MKLAELTSPEVGALSRETVVVIPTGSLEQHGAHLPLFTDSMIVTAVCEAVDQRLKDQILLCPTLWLGASAHHLAFAGSLSASMDGYRDSIRQVVMSLAKHGFWKFLVINGHGGNSSPNDVVCRELKESNPNLLIGHFGYFDHCEEAVSATLEGPFKDMKHACESETSLMMHLYPSLVRTSAIIDDGFLPPVKGMIHPFDELTSNGSLGYATFATAEKGKIIFEAAVEGVASAISKVHTGYQLNGIQ